jgi:hydroxymethylbilane synthase
MVGMKETEGGPLTVTLHGLVGSVSGDRIVKGRIEGRPEDYEKIGIALAEDLLARGAKEILDEVYAG